MSLTTTSDINICSVEFQARHPRLYHYTSKAGLAGIIKSRTLWATGYRNLNDSSEIVHLKEPFITSMIPKFRNIVERHNLDRHMRRLLKKSGGHEKLARDFVNSLYEATFQSENGFTSVEAFISCFCTHADDNPYVREHGLLSQWRGYSGGDGFCIVFDTSTLCHLLGKEFDTHYWVHLEFDAVRYAFEEVPLDDLLPELVEAGAKSLQDFLSGKVPEMDVTKFLAGATLFKHQGFSEEREVRIVAIPGTEKLLAQGQLEHADFPGSPLPNILTLENGARRYIPLLEGCDAQLPIVGVVVGPSRNQAVNARFAHSVVGPTIPISCSETPWLPPHFP